MQGLYPAKVINNNDTRLKGRVQIRIEHLHYGISDAELPWAKQSSLGTGGSNLHGKSNIPENNSFLWVWFEDVDDFQRNPYYLADIHFSDFFTIFIKFCPFGFCSCFLIEFFRCENIFSIGLNSGE